MGRQASDAPQGRRGHCCGHTLTLRLHALHLPQNFGCDTGNWDFKGLTSRNVTLNGAAVEVVGPMTGCDAIATSLEEAMQLQFGWYCRGTACIACLAIDRFRIWVQDLSMGKTSKQLLAKALGGGVAAPAVPASCRRAQELFAQFKNA